MGGTSEGAKRAAATMKAKDPDHFRKIGAKAKDSWLAGGRKPRGFSLMTPEQRSAVSAKGGKISRRK